MIGFIRKLRSKPIAERQKILSVSIVVAMGLVLVIWVIALRERFKKEVSPEALNKDLQPFVLFKQQVQESAGFLKNSPHL
jgi:hypothetical protein